MKPCCKVDEGLLNWVDVVSPKQVDVGSHRWELSTTRLLHVFSYILTAWQLVHIICAAGTCNQPPGWYLSSVNWLVHLSNSWLIHVICHLDGTCSKLGDWYMFPAGWLVHVSSWMAAVFFGLWLVHFSSWVAGFSMWMQWYKCGQSYFCYQHCWYQWR